MDDQRFDALTRAFARGTSRRTAIKGLFGGVIGGVALTARLNNAGAQTPCETADDCILPDACTRATCEDTEAGGLCAYEGGCDEGLCLECDNGTSECVSN